MCLQYWSWLHLCLQYGHSMVIIQVQSCVPKCDYIRGPMFIFFPTKYRARLCNFCPYDRIWSLQRPERNGCYFADSIFKYMHMKDFCSSSEISIPYEIKQVLELMQIHPKPGYFNSKLVYCYKCGILIAARTTPFLHHRTVREGTLTGFPHSDTIFFPENSLRFPGHVLVFPWRDLVDL